ncbi:MAG: hypothetical protein M1434_00145 [Chloroflexi bacterium]|nr:hypothetical protein [Chloroflexota bacterium]MCL5273145.1 hypothetical protein [Chloroflexota bacterium]
MPDLKFALFGAGFWSNFQLPAWLEVGGVQSMAVYNRTRSKAEQFARQYHISRVYDDPSIAPCNAEVVQTLLPLRAEFERAGVVLAIENHDRFAGIARKLGGCAGICPDTANSFGALEGPGIVLETLGPLTVNVHV